MRASPPSSSPVRAPCLVLVLVAWACVWGGVAGVGWEACEGPVCLEVRRQAEGLSRLKFLRNYINQTVSMMNTLVSTLEEELVKTSEGLAQFIGPRCPAAHPILLEVTKPADPAPPVLQDEEGGIITDSDEDYDLHSSPPPSERERLDAGSGSQYWQGSGSSSHSNLHGSGGGSGKTLTGQKATSSAIKTDKSSSSSTTSSSSSTTSSSSSSSSRVTSSSSVDSGPSTTNKFNTIGGQEPSRPSHKTTGASHVGVSVAASSQEEDSDDTQNILGLGGVGQEVLDHSGSGQGNLGHGGAGRGNLGPGGAGQDILGLGLINVGPGGAGRGILGPGANRGNLGQGGSGRGNLGQGGSGRGNLGHGGSGRGNLRPGDSGGANQGNWFYDWGNESHEGANRGHGGANRGHGGANRGHGGANRGHDDGRGRDIGSGGSRWRACHSVARGSPHWVPGLDQWCVTSCAAGYCPPSHCIC